MSHTVTAPRAIVAPVVIPVREVFAWSVFVVVFACFLVYLVGYEQGALSIFDGTGVHEWMHDGRHLFAFPCH
jgi:hypothetical protein